MSTLVSLSEFKTYLGDAPDADDAVLEDLLDQVEAMFERATLRAPGSFAAADTGVTEVLDGTGSSRLYLAYPIAALTSITLGYDPSSPIETLNVASPSVVVYGVGSRVITRTDGGWFGTVRQPRYVHVVYDHAGELPEDAKLAVKSVAALAYRRRGSEAEKSETVGSFYSHTMVDDIASADPFWQRAVAAHSPVVIA